MSCHSNRAARPTPERWLEARIGAGLTLTPASADASHRRYFRVHGAGPTRILMDAPPEHEDCRAFVRVARLLRAVGVNAPEVVVEDFENGFVLLEDFGDETFLSAVERGVDPAGPYRDAIGTLVRMQCLTVGVEALPSYDERLLRFELSLFTDWFLALRAGIDPPPWLPALEDRLVAAALDQPQVFVHRDYHSRNLMLVRDRNPGVLDFQDAVFGPVSYDLVSLLRDAYIRWPEARVEGWIAEYRMQAIAAGVDCGPDIHSFRRWFDLMGIQRQLKVAGIFARLSHRDGKARYLADIPRTLGYARDAARRYRDFAQLSEWLDKVVLPALQVRGGG